MHSRIKHAIVLTRGSAPRAIDRNPPHDCPMTATLAIAILPFSGEPSRVFSFSAQSTCGTQTVRGRLPSWRTFLSRSAHHEEAVRRDRRQET